MAIEESPGGSNDGREAVYVVGIDGSDASVDALRWALTEAKRSGARIEAVATWQFPAIGLERPSLARTLHADTEHTLERSVEMALDDIDPADDRAAVPIRTIAYQSPPADRLVAMSKRADLVVVGRRSRHVLGPLGSVSSHVAGHAHCPVVVVPPR